MDMTRNYGKINMGGKMFDSKEIWLILIMFGIAISSFWLAQIARTLQVLVSTM